ncbi:unnamed protein product, partial [Oppiella nova]
YNIRSTPLDLLLQDKLCVNNYSLSRYFCYNLYIPVIILWALFLGHWTDEYGNGRKAIFIVGSFIQCLEAIISLLNVALLDSDVRWITISFVPYIVSGSMVWSIAYAYVAATTPANMRPIRMMALEISLALSHLVSDSVYGRVAFDDPMWTTNQIYSQSFIHAISA